MLPLALSAKSECPLVCLTVCFDLVFWLSDFWPWSNFWLGDFRARDFEFTRESRRATRLYKLYRVRRSNSVTPWDSAMMTHSDAPGSIERPTFDRTSCTYQCRSLWKSLSNEITVYYALTLSVREELLFDYGIWNLHHVESCHTHTRSLFLFLFLCRRCKDFFTTKDFPYFIILKSKLWMLLFRR